MKPIQDEILLLFITNSAQGPPFVCYECDEQSHYIFFPEVLAIDLSSKPKSMAEVLNALDNDEYTRHATEFVGING